MFRPGVAQGSAGVVGREVGDGVNGAIGAVRVAVAIVVVVTVQRFHERGTSGGRSLAKASDFGLEGGRQMEYQAKKEREAENFVLSI